jgi:hypothetical protein
MADPKIVADDKRVQEPDPERQNSADSDIVSIGKGDILQLEHTDPVLNAKMHLINNAIDEIGESIPSRLVNFSTDYPQASHATNGSCSSSTASATPSTRLSCSSNLSSQVKLRSSSSPAFAMA